MCPICGAAELVHGTRDASHTYKRETTIIPLVTGNSCPACGDAIFGKAESGRVSTSMREFSKQVSAAIVDPAFTADVPEKPDPDQREAAETFGGGTGFVAKP